MKRRAKRESRVQPSVSKHEKRRRKDAMSTNEGTVRVGTKEATDMESNDDGK